LKPEPDRLLAVLADVSDEASVEALKAKTLAAFGQANALVANAGIAAPGNAAIEELSLESWNKTIAVNLTGCFLAAKHFAAPLKASKGAIVNIASTRALMSERGTEAYSASKGGIVALTHALAVSLGPLVRVNCISPGWIETADWKKPVARKAPFHSEADKTQHPCGRVGEPEDIGALTRFLISSEASFITGQNFICDGGMTKKMIYV
jgi:NAD(P)-dependent dehydrogenase (short-subunit alcohol dehydrogenase family)